MPRCPADATANAGAPRQFPPNEESPGGDGGDKVDEGGEGGKEVRHEALP